MLISGDIVITSFRWLVKNQNACATEPAWPYLPFGNAVCALAACHILLKVQLTHWETSLILRQDC